MTSLKRLTVTARKIARDRGLFPPVHLARSGKCLAFGVISSGDESLLTGAAVALLVHRECARTVSRAIGSYDIGQWFDRHRHGG
jgi:hypothetical protein